VKAATCRSSISSHPANLSAKIRNFQDIPFAYATTGKHIKCLYTFVDSSENVRLCKLKFEHASVRTDSYTRSIRTTEMEKKRGGSFLRNPTHEVAEDKMMEERKREKMQAAARVHDSAY